MHWRPGLCLGSRCESSQRFPDPELGYKGRGEEGKESEGTKDKGKGRVEELIEEGLGRESEMGKGRGEGKGTCVAPSFSMYIRHWSPLRAKAKHLHLQKNSSTPRASNAHAEGVPLEFCNGDGALKTGAMGQARQWKSLTMRAFV